MKPLSIRCFMHDIANKLKIWWYFSALIIINTVPNHNRASTIFYHILLSWTCWCKWYEGKFLVQKTWSGLIIFHHFFCFCLLCPLLAWLAQRREMLSGCLFQLCDIEFPIVFATIRFHCMYVLYVNLKILLMSSLLKQKHLNDVTTQTTFYLFT